MYKSLQLTLPLNNILFGTEPFISPKNITDEMKNNDRYDCYTLNGAFHNQTFCCICDILKFPINFHKLFDHYFSLGGKEVTEIILYHSKDDFNTFIAFDLWWGRTDQCGVINTGVSVNAKIWNEIYDMFKIISCDCFPFASPNIKIPSELTEALQAEYNGKCFFRGMEYNVKHIN